MKGKIAKEEQEILESFEAGEWKSAKNLPGEKKRYESYARKTFKKNISTAKKTKEKAK